ncbi:MAG: Fe2+-dependent dioxygenase [Gammaproteobacteria bacterium]|nr:Fe2+-dependent dioxygenase [Gammaproteobacteria bacterium]MBU0786324.1 Fe2+-dependent dioxygenase [Gammaproteobacteria bacterium]MBU0814456.1 Fe2+-dependent dioxygenase [Gammaproteobacteria bacterium]MBU1786701.1 Fe2+-dependent dioxygenase [Gammaproteobacteria bacterium]
MLIHLKNVLSPDELQQARATLHGAHWVDGNSTAGAQAVQVKNNEQLPQGGEAAKTLQALLLQALNRHALFFSAALPKKIFNPLFNRYSGDSNHYGPHIDGAVMHSRSDQQRVRTDVSCTLFLSEPSEYEGGELCIEDSYGPQQIKFPAGDMVLYPGTSLHQVRPVTRGQRLASFFWVESMVRSDEQRRLLYELDMSLLRLRHRHGETAETTTITGTYHNLLRMWADT